MSAFRNDLDNLAWRVAQGDPDGPAEFRRQFEPTLEKIVRLTLEEGTERNPVDRWVLAEARRLFPAPAEIPRQDATIGFITRNLCDSFLARLARNAQAPQANLDTVWN